MEQPPACPVSRWELLKKRLNNLDPQTFRRKMVESGVVLIDVRTRAEYDTFHLPGAIHLDYFAPDLIDQLETLDPTTTYLVYCRSGRRSLRVCTLMRNSGFATVFNLDEGLNVWNYS